MPFLFGRERPLRCGACSFERSTAPHRLSSEPAGPVAVPPRRRWRAAALEFTPIDRVVRKGNFNALRFEGLLDASIHFWTDVPLLDRFGLDPAFDDHCRISEPVDPQHFQRIAHKNHLAVKKYLFNLPKSQHRWRHGIRPRDKNLACSANTPSRTALLNIVPSEAIRIRYSREAQMLGSLNKLSP